MNADSVKAKLKNYARESGRSFQEALVYYGLERTIYRISVSEYADHFVLKGGIFLYAIFEKNYARATTDIDLLARRISNSSESMQEVFKKIFSLNCEDGLKFDVSSVFVENITEFKEYHGLNISVIAYLDKTRIPVSIDIGFGDIISPDSVKMNFPVILENDIPVVNAYSIESAIAEKLEAIVHNGYMNSRYKDFYDICILILEYDFDFISVNSAVRETFYNRKTELSENISAFSIEFINDQIHQKRWDNFLRKKKTMHPIALSDAINLLKIFSKPLFNEQTCKVVKWNHSAGSWE